jgi:tetratricopeptide (TPR) repeat protein
MKNAPAPAPNERALVIKLLVALVVFIGLLVRLGMSLLPDASAAAYNRGVEAYTRKDYAGSVQAFKTATEKNPNFAPAWMNRALAELELKDFPAAQASARKSIDLLESGKADGLPKGKDANAMRAQAHANLGMVLMQSGQAKDALPELEKALATDPGNAKSETWKLAAEGLRNKGSKPSSNPTAGE